MYENLVGKINFRSLLTYI